MLPSEAHCSTVPSHRKLARQLLDVHVWQMPLLLGRRVPEG